MDAGTAKFDLTLSLARDRPRACECACEYSTDLFDAATVDAHGAAPARGCWRPRWPGPSARVSALPLLAEAERHQVLVEWNATRRATSRATPASHALFEAQAARTPDAVAVRFEGQHAHLRGSSTRAPTSSRTHLRALGVGPEVRVAPVPGALAGAWSSALLGILKAGGAYVPLDPATRGAAGAHAGGQRGAAVLVTTERAR